MRGIAASIALMGCTAAAAFAQQPTIEVRRIRVIGDGGGKGLSRAPFSIMALPGGRYAMSQINETPFVVDSTGRLVKRFAKGKGPGEFEGPSAQFAMRGDSILASDVGGINVFDRDLHFGRKLVASELYFSQFFPLSKGFVVAAPRANPPTIYTGIHVLDETGSVVRSFLVDTMVDRRGPQPNYQISPSGANSLWAASNRGHRMEKWSVDGKRLVVIDTQPPWFYIGPTYQDGRSYLRAARESDGILWVMSSVPVSDYRARMTKAIQGRNEVDVRQIPTEQLSTAWLEAYDAATGKPLAERPLKAFGITLLAGNQYAIYSETADGLPQVEIWEMKLRR